MFFRKMLGTLVDQSKFKQNIAMLKDGEYEIVPYKKDRTSEQNRYLWGGVYQPIAEYIGEDKDYVHGVMGMKFLLDKSKKHPYIRSTTSLNTAEFAKYVDGIRDWMATFGLYIPSPEERKRANGILENEEN